MDATDFPGPVNLGNPEELTVIGLAKLIKELTASSSKIVHKSLPEDDPSRRRPDISLAMDKLGWTPSWNTKDALVNTIKNFEDRLRKGERV
ncbi:MAG: SDR family NAD-dependent epimerase/dehydratase, partial [SAR324 cluster bacterium]|nr:SDR family NAD-dependent epimerase/dehydratase [SAR324 cluster bacterium]